MSELVKHIEQSLTKTNNYESKITEDILGMDGMTGIKTRHFYNNICSMHDARYLEIGTCTGSSFCAAMCNNNMKCTAIDNWSEFSDHNPKQQFIENFNKFKGINNANFIENDCFKVNISELGPFNIYLYDAAHDEVSQYNALNNYLMCLDNEFIFIIDDWNWLDVREGTLKAIKNNNLEIIYKKEIRTTDDNTHGHPHSKESDWHNGICIFVLKKIDIN